MSLLGDGYERSAADGGGDVRVDDRTFRTEWNSPARSADRGPLIRPQLGRMWSHMLHGGSIGDHRVASPDWVDRIRTGGSPRLMGGTEFNGLYPNGRYSTQWWNTGNHRGTLYAVGIYGQFLWIDPTADVVIAKLSSLPRALDPVVSRDHHAAFGAVTAALD